MARRRGWPPVLPFFAIFARFVSSRPLPSETWMKITEIKTFLVDATPPGGWGGGGRNWLFVKVETDEGISGVGEASGWPRVIETAVQDLKSILLGQDPGRIELLWQKM